MTDRELVESIINQGSGYWSYYHYISMSFIKFNDQNKCTHLTLVFEELVEIPDELLELKHLKHLDLNFNKLTYIPDELKQIEDLYTDGNLLLESNDKVELLFNRSILNDR